DMDPVDAMSLLRLSVLDVQRTTDLATLEKRVETIKADARRLTSGGEMSANRIAQVSLELEKVQRQLRAAAERAEAPSKSRAEGLGKSIDEVTESAFQSALKASGGADLRTYQAYTEHLLSREYRKRCLEMVDEALK